MSKLGTATKIGYGIGDVGGNLYFTLIGFYLLFFLTESVGLSAGLAGSAIAIGKIWDAVTDPAVGFLSDRTVTRWGRRRPYMLFGAIALFFTMIIMFAGPRTDSQGLLFVWATIAFCLVGTAYTAVNIPYSALAPELTHDYHERSVLNGYRMISAVVGTLIGAATVLPLVALFGGGRIGWAMMGGVMGAVMTITTLVTFFAVKESPHEVNTDGPNILRSYASALRLKPFLFALLPWTFNITGVTIIQGSLLFYFKYIYGDEPAFQLALIILLIVSMVFIPVWIAISKRIGKKLTYNLGMGIFAVIIILFFLLGPSLGVPFAMVVMAISGVGFATHYAMPYAIIPDIVEYDYAENGTRREGVFYGIWTFASKLGQALAVAASGWLLAALGFVAESDQNGATIWGIRFLVGPIPVLFFIAAIVVLSYYPITQPVYQQVLERIRKREQG